MNKFHIEDDYVLSVAAMTPCEHTIKDVEWTKKVAKTNIIICLTFLQTNGKHNAEGIKQKMAQD